ncbi:MAG TPA: serine/threonine-protein kinase [Myxococcota bacterium]|nr:serine/threonine-protein kinase [Myxococcota bacterium]
MSGTGPRTIGNFTIERELGSGGMGVVLLGRHQSLERPAVLKRLRPDLSSSAELVERFAREARSAASIHHANVVAVYDWIAWRGEHYIAQEYVDGVDLRAALAQAQRFPWRIAALVALELTRGLEAIHARGMVHRDLKPANVLLGRNGDVKIADFGIAIDATSDGLTRPGTTIGSPPYIAPEQLLGERVDARGDLFGLGIVLYELLCGAPPYREPAEGETESLLTRVQRERYQPVRSVARDVPRWLVRLVKSLVRAKPRSRPASAQRVRRLLESRLRAFPNEARLELASWLWEEGVFKPREGDTVVLSSELPSRWRARLARGLAYAAALVCALGIGSFVAVGVPGLQQLAGRARVATAPPSADAELEFTLDQPLALAIDGAAAQAVQPEERRSLAPGRHHLVLEWPSGARLELDLELAAGELRRVRPERPEPTPAP